MLGAGSTVRPRASLAAEPSESAAQPWMWVTLSAQAPAPPQAPSRTLQLQGCKQRRRLYAPNCVSIGERRCKQLKLILLINAKWNRIRGYRAAPGISGWRLRAQPGAEFELMAVLAPGTLTGISPLPECWGPCRGVSWPLLPESNPGSLGSHMRISVALTLPGMTSTVPDSV